MTNCKECLTALSTARVADISPGSAIAIHCYTCPECNRVAEEVRYAEYMLAASLNDAKPLHDGVEMAVFASGESERLRRRRIGRWIRIGLAIPAAAILGFALEATLEDDPPGMRRVVTETIKLRCLSPQVAAELVTPYLRSHGTAVYRADAAQVITLRGQSSEVAAAIMQIDRFDSPDSCAIPGTPAPATSVGTPGKD